MQIDPKTLSPSEAYALMIGAVIPRPIAWISTLRDDGKRNLAPYSFYGGVSSKPPSVMLSVGRRDGIEKDTGDNLKANGEAVIHVPDRSLAEAMVESSGEFPPDVDEFEHCGLETCESTIVKPPRIARAKVAMEARVVEHHEFGLAPVDLFLLEILLVHVDDQVLDERGRIDAEAVAACGRLGGIGYTVTDTGNLKMKRPD